MKMNFILPHSFELDLRGIPLLSTLELLLFGHSNILVRAKAFIMGITSCGSIWIARGFILDRLFCFRVIDAQDRLVVVFLYGGNIPFVVSLCFASQRTPTACPCCAGSISTIGLRSFLLKVSGSNSLLSFCYTSLVSGLIIQEDARFVYWQTAQRKDFVFVQC